MVLPSRKQSRVKSIVTYEGEQERAFPPQSVTLTLEDEIDISRGDMLVPVDNVPYFSDRVDAQIVWMTEAPMQPGKQYLFKQATRRATGAISDIRFKTDVNTLEQAKAETLNLNEIGRCEITLSQRLAFDSYKANRNTGAFIIIDRLTNETVGAGMIVGVGAAQAVDWEETPDNAHLAATESLIAPAERSARFGQQPKTLLLTGLTGAGKSTIAWALERKLFDMGRASFVLTGQNMRLGPSKDLGFDDDSRNENARRATEIAKLMNQAGLISILAFVAPREEIREKAREALGDDLLVVHLNTPVEVCKERDRTGLYEAVDEEGLETVPGVNAPFEEPVSPDLVLPTHELTVEESVEQLVALLESKGAF